MFHRRKKIICYVLIYEQVEIIKKSLDFITQSSSSLEIVVIENKSKNSPQISRYVDNLGKKGKLSRYYFFEENITNNAYDAVLSAEADDIAQCDFVIITDGDVLGSGTDWLKEVIRAARDRRVFACGITFSMDNLPVATFPEAVGWVPPASNVRRHYLEGKTGIHLLTLRTKNLQNFLKWKQEHGYNFIDNRMHEFAELQHLRWARTKKNEVTHLTWDLYQDLNHDYTKKKRGKFNEIWHHERTASYTVTKY